MNTRAAWRVFASRLVLGIVGGAFLGVVLAAYAVILFLARGPETFRQGGTTLAGAVFAYVVGGLVGGAVVGATLPLGQWALGAAVVGFLGALALWTAVSGFSGIPTLASLRDAALSRRPLAFPSALGCGINCADSVDSVTVSHDRIGRAACEWTDAGGARTASHGGDASVVGGDGPPVVDGVRRRLCSSVPRAESATRPGLAAGVCLGHHMRHLRDGSPSLVPSVAYDVPLQAL